MEMNNNDLLQDEVRRRLNSDDETFHWLSNHGPNVPIETKPGRGWLVQKGPFEDREMPGPKPIKVVHFADVPSSPSKNTGISRPGPALNVTHLSACIDPKTLDPQESVVFPSGEKMDYDYWFQDPKRPRSIRERQEGIIQNFRMQTVVESVIGSEKTSRRQCWLKSIFERWRDTQRRIH